ncbi:MAG: peptidylprolyl isomerase [Oscillospiraceae bacterium]|nr:peptidylprolyl isomerase [Oscillospiraceae bacterium]
MKKIVALLLAAIMMISVFAGCSGEKAPETKGESSVALKIGDMEFTTEDMNYMYVVSFNDLYNYYYSAYGNSISYILDVTKPLEEQMLDENTSWHQYITDIAVGTTKSIVGVYNKAKAEGFVLPEDYQTDLDTLEQQLDEISAESGMTREEYLAANYGGKVSLEAIKKMTEIQFYCNAYVQDYKEKIEISEEEIDAYYKENKKDIDSVNFRYYSSFYGEAEGEEKTLTQEEAENQANRISETKTADEFNALAKEFTTDEELKKLFDEGDATLFPSATYSSIGIDEVSEWLFDAARKTGDTMVYHDEQYQSYLTVMFEELVDPDYDFVNVRHILLVPPAEEGATPSEQAWAEAESRANEVLDKYLAGEMTEEAFGELAKEYSADGNASRGGIYENVYKGQMVPAFNDWCFDPARAIGDTGIVKTPYGYHVMYFSGIGDNNLVSLIEPTLVQGKTSALIAECEANLTEERTAEMENVGGMIDDIVSAASAAGEGETTEETEKETKSFTGIIIGGLIVIIVICIVVIVKNGGKKKVEPVSEIEEYEESVLEATDEDLTEEELLAEETFEESVPEEEAAEEVSEETEE